MNPGRFEEQPIPETTSTLWGGTFSSTSASLIDFSTPKSPQPGHQSGWTAPSKSLSVSSAVAIGTSLDRALLARCNRMTAVHRSRVRADHEQGLETGVFTVQQLHLPHRLAVAVPLELLEAA